MFQIATLLLLALGVMHKLSFVRNTVNGKLVKSFPSLFSWAHKRFGSSKVAPAPDIELETEKDRYPI